MQNIMTGRNVLLGVMPRLFPQACAGMGGVERSGDSLVARAGSASVRSRPAWARRNQAATAAAGSDPLTARTRSFSAASRVF